MYAGANIPVFPHIKNSYRTLLTKNFKKETLVRVKENYVHPKK